MCVSFVSPPLYPMFLSAKEDGFIRVGSDQMKAAKIAEQNKLRKELARRPGEKLDQEVDGMPSEKMAFVEDIAQIRLTKEEGCSIVTTKEKQLNETENTLKFAVFCLAFMSVSGLRCHVLTASICFSFMYAAFLY